MPILERNDFVADLCDDAEMRFEIEKMLAFADDETDALESNAFEIFTNEAKIPEKIGKYKIVREIGRGGMGAVYEAVYETENFTQRVALKVIKRGMDTDAILSRFRHEQQILASLEHPNIARFLDGGMTENDLPFYAMEFVEGEFIDDFCRRENCSFRDKLELFRKVCAAVGYAHQNLVIHRDLKPKNILVNEGGEPKLLDFGIGKILSLDAGDEIGTATELGMMTPAYASPEQIRGARIGTASDIYALGVILFELLTGEKPYKLNAENQIELQKAILQTEPTKPSRIQNAKLKIQNSEKIDKDIDNIILKTLRKNPNRRYSSVQEFSEDIRRHLSGLPVYARPLTVKYRASKFYQRNKIPVFAGLLIFVSLISGITIAIWQAHEARLAEMRAKNQFNQVRQLANNVVFKYHDQIADLQGSAATRKNIVADALNYLDKLANDSEDNPELQTELARAYLKMGDVQGKPFAPNLGETDAALESYKKAFAISRNLLEKNGENVKILMLSADSSRKIGSILTRKLKFDEAEKFLNNALRTAQTLAEKNPSNVGIQTLISDIYMTLGDFFSRKSDKKKAIENFRNSLAIKQKTLATNSANAELRREIAVNYQRIGNDLYSTVRIENEGCEKTPDVCREAQNAHRRATEILQKLKAENPSNFRYKRDYYDQILMKAPLEIRLGDKEFVLEQSRNAAGELENLAETDAGNVELRLDVGYAFYNLAITYISLKDHAQACVYWKKSGQNLKKYLEQNPNNTDARADYYTSVNRRAESERIQENFQKSAQLSLQNLAERKASDLPISKLDYFTQYARIAGDYLSLAKQTADKSQKAKHFQNAKIYFLKAKENFPTGQYNSENSIFRLFREVEESIEVY